LQIILPDGIEQRLITALKDAGDQEIGGILMGEHVAGFVYRIQDITIQYHHGTFVSFVRVIQEILNPLRQFFRRTGHNFVRFNYLGEWHSHPSYALVPSNVDSETMWEIVEDPKVGANFAALMIIRLNATDHVEGTVTIYLPGHRMFRGKLAREETTI
jgi:hypothetical protein